MADHDHDHDHDQGQPRRLWLGSFVGSNLITLGRLRVQLFLQRMLRRGSGCRTAEGYRRIIA